MERVRVKPWKGKFVFRAKANKINDMLLSAPKPDRTELEKEAQEFIELIKERRSQGRYNVGIK